MAKEPEQPTTNPDPSKKGDDPGTTPKTEDTSSGFDLSKLSDKDLDKVLEDPRMWKKPALKDLVETRKKLREREKADSEAEETRLAEQKKFEELATKAQKERDEAQQRFQNTLINSEIIKEAAKLNPQDVDAVTKLIDSSNISIGEDGKVSGVVEALTSLQESKPFLFGKSTPRKIGEGTNPSDPDTGELTISKIQDPAYYQKNRDSILKNIGQIKDDRGTPKGR